MNAAQEDFSSVCLSLSSVDQFDMPSSRQGAVMDAETSWDNTRNIVPQGVQIERYEYALDDIIILVGAIIYVVCNHEVFGVDADVLGGPC